VIQHHSDGFVIPGRRAAASPESIIPALEAMDSGFAPSARAGMTALLDWLTLH